MRLGIDLGGTKIEIIALDANGKEFVRKRELTPSGDYQATLLVIKRLVDSVEAETGEKDNVGIATPGAISPASGLLKNSNSTCLNGKPLLQDLESLLSRPIRIANDADCFALSESVDGAAAGAANVFGVILGTGTGGGVVVNGQLLSGPNAIAGEWGHNPLPWPQEDELPGPACYCGKRGCIETWCSGPGLAHDHVKHTGQQQNAEEICGLAEKGNVAAEQALQRYEDRLARALSSVINVLDPEIIVLGGGLSNMQRLYKNIPLLWGQYVFSDRVDTRLVQARHGDSSGVRGAAWLWPA
jgi:fructokinase